MIQGEQIQNVVANSATAVTRQRKTLKIFVTVCIVIILIIVGGLIISSFKIKELTEQSKPAVTQVTQDPYKEFRKLSRQKGILSLEVWNWIMAVKVEMTFNLNSAHSYYDVSTDGKKLYQRSVSSPEREPTGQQYLICLCVSSMNLLDIRSYMELEVVKTVPWTIGLRKVSFDADINPDSETWGGIWTISSENGKIVINDGTSRSTPYATPTRLGLYLDYKHGQVSFYDAMTRLHLHTYLPTFKEKILLYAAFHISLEENANLLATFL